MKNAHRIRLLLFYQKPNIIIDYKIIKINNETPFKFLKTFGYGVLIIIF